MLVNDTVQDLGYKIGPGPLGSAKMEHVGLWRRGVILNELHVVIRPIGPCFQLIHELFKGYLGPLFADALGELAKG